MSRATTIVLFFSVVANLGQTEKPSTVPMVKIPERPDRVSDRLLPPVQPVAAILDPESHLNQRKSPLPNTMSCALCSDLQRVCANWFAVA